MDKSVRCRLGGKGGKLMLTLLLGTTLQNRWNQGALYVYTFFSLFFNDLCKPKRYIELPKFASIHKPSVGCVDIDDPLDVSYSSFLYISSDSLN